MQALLTRPGLQNQSLSPGLPVWQSLSPCLPLWAGMPAPIRVPSRPPQAAVWGVDGVHGPPAPSFLPTTPDHGALLECLGLLAARLVPSEGGVLSLPPTSSPLPLKLTSSTSPRDSAGDGLPEEAVGRRSVAESSPPHLLLCQVLLGAPSPGRKHLFHPAVCHHCLLVHSLH